MSSVSSVGSSSVAASQFAPKARAPQAAVDPDHDGDNDAGVSQASEASEQSAPKSAQSYPSGIDVEA